MAEFIKTVLLFVCAIVLGQVASHFGIMTWRKVSARYWRLWKMSQPQGCVGWMHMQPCDNQVPACQCECTKFPHRLKTQDCKADI